MAKHSKRVFARFKPTVGRRVHLFLAPFLWTSIGCLLIVRGWGWLAKGSNYWFVLFGLCLGMLKSFFILDKTAKKGVARIIEFQDSTCLGAVYSWKTWMLVGLMMLFGFVLRKFIDPGVIAGTLYIAIGWALIFSSRFGWIQWIRGKKSDTLG